MSWRGYMVGTYGCARADAAANYRTQNPYRSIGMSDRAAAAALNGSSGCPTSRQSGNSSAQTEDDLAAAAKSGQGITKRELRDIMSQALDKQDAAGRLDRPTRRALRQAVNNDAFARKSTAQLALQLSQGKISPAAIGARLGRAE